MLLVRLIDEPPARYGPLSAAGERGDLSFTYHLEPGASAVKNGLPYEYDTTHRMTVHTASETTLSFMPLRRKGGLGHSTVVFVLPGGDVVVVETG